MGQYKKKPVVINAWRTPAEGAEPDPELADIVRENDWEANDDGIIIPTLEGNMMASPGDWLIRGIKGEYYPCQADIFEASYEKVSE